MRKSLFILALLVSTFILPLAACADTLLDFTLTGPPGVVTFTLPEHPFFQDTLHLVTVGTRTSASFNGVSGYSVDLSFFTGIADFPDSLLLNLFSLEPSLGYAFGVNLYGPLLLSPYRGSDYPPPAGDLTGLISTGDFGLTAYSITTDMPINYSLEVTPEAATTPEPSTLILLLTGACGILSLAARRREGRVTQV